MLRLPFLLAARGRPPVHRVAGGAGDPPVQLLAVVTRQFADVTVEDAATRKKHAGYYSRVLSKLESRKNPPSIEEIDAFANDLMAYLDVSKTKALHTIALRPQIMTQYSQENLARKTAWLQENGSTKKQISKMICRQPHILERTIETMEAKRDWYIEQGVAPEKIPDVFAKCSQVLCSSITTNLNPKVELLKSFGLQKKHISRILFRHPQVLSSSVEVLERNITFLLKHCVSREELPMLLANAPACLYLSPENMKAKLLMFEEMFGPEPVQYMVCANPSVLMHNNEQLRRSYNFLMELGVSPERLAKSLRLIMRSTDRILKPRAKFLEAAGILQTSMESPFWISASYPAFIERFPDYVEYAKQHDSH